MGWIQLARCLQVVFIWFDTSRRPTALLPAGSSVSPFASAALHFHERVTNVHDRVQLCVGSIRRDVITDLGHAVMDGPAALCRHAG